jgi:hypothetical protein
MKINKDNISEEIDRLYKDKDCQGIMSSSAKSFTSILSKDEIDGCKYRALWKAIVNFDESRGVKFLTFLHKGVFYECKTAIKPYIKDKTKYIDPDFLINVEDNKISDFDFEDLKSIEDGEILIDIYLYRFKMKELTVKYNLTANEITKRKNRVLSELRRKIAV